MKKFNPSTILLALIMYVCAGALVGCTDSDYDLDEIDSTIGIGGGELTLPVSSTDTIKLLDVLKLNDSESVVIDSKGDYIFKLTGTANTPVHPSVDKVTVAEKAIMPLSLPLVFTSATSYDFEGRVQEFTYEGSKPAEIIDLEEATVDNAQMRFTFNFPSEAAAYIGTKIDNFTVMIPSYAIFGAEDVTSSCSTFTVDGSVIKLTDVPTGSPLTVSVSIRKLKFNTSDTSLGSLVISDDKVSLSGIVKAKVSGEIRTTGTAPTGAKMTSVMAMDDIVISKAKGHFNPSIALDDLGKLDVNGVPDFLSDGNVVADIHNPRILLTLTNDMPAQGFVSGTIKSHKGGAQIAAVNVPEMKLKANGTTSICICRHAEGITGFDQVIEVSNLSDVIRTIPDRISFDATARADKSQACEFELGKSYTVQPQYSVNAPIAFGKDAKIVYNDVLDGWNEDIQDVQLATNSYIQVTGKIKNRVPAHMNLEVKLVDTNGNLMSDDRIVVEVSDRIQASPNGIDVVETPVTVKLIQKQANAFKDLDGLKFIISGMAKGDDGTSIEGITLNSEKHSLIADDIKVKIVGRIIVDCN